MNKLHPQKRLSPDDKHNVCPVCGKLRSGGIKFIDHGACAEKAAAADAKRDPNNFGGVSKENQRKARFNGASKKLLNGSFLKGLGDV